MDKVGAKINTWFIDKVKYKIHAIEKIKLSKAFTLHLFSNEFSDNYFEYKDIYVDKKVNKFVCKNPYFKGKNLNKFIANLFAQVVEKNNINSIAIKKYKTYNEENYTRYSISLLQSANENYLISSEDLMIYIVTKDQAANHLFISRLKQGDIMYFSLPVRVLSVTETSVKYTM